MLDLYRFEEAAAAFQRAIELDPGLAPAYLHLGEAHVERGAFGAVLEAYRRGRTLATEPAEKLPWAERITQCESMLRVAERVRRIAAGEPAPEKPERLQHLARAALAIGDAAVARRLFGEAADSPDASDYASNESRLQWAVASVLPSNGSAPVSVADGGSLRREAHRCFRDRLDADRQPASTSVAREVRIRWLRFLNDPRLAAVRDADRLAELPEAERRDWSLLWEDARRFLGIDERGW